MTKKPSSLEELATFLQKKFGPGAIRKLVDTTALEVVSSGILTLDYISGVGGLPRGMNTVLQGMPGAGKTEIALQCAKHYLDTHPDQQVAFIDVEYRLLKERCEKMGLDFNRFHITQNSCVEEVMEIVVSLLESGYFGMIIVDSLSMASPRNELNGEYDSLQPGQQSKAIQAGFRRIVECMSRVQSKCINIFVNQLMAKIGAMKFEKKTTAKSGLAPQYMSSFTIDVTRLNNKDSIEKDEHGNHRGVDIKIDCSKNSISNRQFRKGTFHLVYGEGVVKVTELINLGLGFGLITQAGRTYHIGDTKAVGWDALVSTLESNKTLQSILESDIYKCIHEGKDTTDGSIEGELEDA